MMSEDFTYVEEVVIRDALNKENCLAINHLYQITCTDSCMAIGFINIESYRTLESLKVALLEFKKKYKERGKSDVQ